LKYVRRAQEILDIEIQGLTQVRDGMGLEFSRSVDLILKALEKKGKIIITGVGKNLHVGQKMAATLTSTGAPAVVLHPLEAMHGDLGILDSNDVVIALSYSGETEEVLNLLPAIKRSNVKVIALTGEMKSTLAKSSDEVIPVTVEREACPFNMAPTTSTTATLAMGDALAMVLLEARGFKKEDYAQLHPGGSIGQTLLLKVGDIMRTDERVAEVARGAKVKDAVLAMTSARAGSAAVVDESRKVLGIITDGDLRRHITGTANVGEQPVEDVMTPGPITLSVDQLAVDVLSIYEKHNIDDLIVVDDGERLVGMIDIQDLPKFKIL
jgi:arabinose-5-phosphate isomerase